MAVELSAAAASNDVLKSDGSAGTWREATGGHDLVWFSFPELPESGLNAIFA